MIWYKNDLEESLSTSFQCKLNSTVEEAKPEALAVAGTYFKKRWGVDFLLLHAAKKIDKQVAIESITGTIIATFDLETISRVLDVHCPGNCLFSTKSHFIRF